MKIDCNLSHLYRSNKEWEDDCYKIKLKIEELNIKIEGNLIDDYSLINIIKLKINIDIMM